MRSLTSAKSANVILNFLKRFRVVFQFNDKRRIIQYLNFLGITSRIREMKGIAFFNFNAEIAIKIRTNTAVGTFYPNDRTNQRLFIFRINHLTCYLKLFGTYTTDDQNKDV